MSDFLENNADFKAQEQINETKPSEPKKVKKRKKLLIILLAVLGVLVISVCLFFVEISGKTLKSEVNITIEKGMSSAQIAKTVKENGLVSSTLLFRIYGRLGGYDSSYKYGTYTFSGKNSYKDICLILNSDGGSAKTVTVTIPEGTPIKDYKRNLDGNTVTIPGIATLLENAGVCKKEDFFNALNNVELNSKLLSNANTKEAYIALEGYLFPDTYEFYCHDSKECAFLAVEKMISAAESKITDEMFKRAEEMGYSMNEILTLASIVQLEAGVYRDEMPNVAAVFYNRLNSYNFSTLGSSPSCYYGDAFSNDDGRYDTYKSPGLPPGPLCSPSIEAINAALYPSNNEYYYFVTDSKGKFYFSKTYSEHQNIIDKLQKDGNWIYEYLN